jgi:hypothetical protein
MEPAVKQAEATDHLHAPGFRAKLDAARKRAKQEN